MRNVYRPQRMTLLNPAAAAEYLGLSCTLLRWARRDNPSFIPFIQLGHQIWYDCAVLEECERDGDHLSLFGHYRPPRQA